MTNIHNSTIDQLFEKQVVKHPNNIALIYQNESITYEELNYKSNCLAEEILVNNFGDNIGILMDTSIDYVIAILAVLKAGKTYVPLSNKLPEERLQYIIDDANIKKVIINSSIYYYKSNIKNAYYHYKHKEIPRNEIGFNMSQSEKNAYIIYTSGTTGNPKGVPIKNSSICNTLLWKKQFYKLDSNHNNLLSFSFLFDGSILSLFSFLISGGSVTLVKDDDKANINLIKDTILKNDITHLFMIPSLLIELLSISTVSNFSKIQVISLGGEMFPKSIATNEIIKANSICLSNLYGPTESSVAATCLKGIDESNYNSIGFPITGIEIKVLNEELEEVGVNEKGELYISGIGLTDGYLNNPQKNNESFINYKGQRYYKTGDIVKKNANGSINYISRKDYQVKIRGHRVELEEIENTILEHPNVKNVSVLIKKLGNTSELISYYTKNNHCDDLPTVLKMDLEKKLPKYMIPISFIEIKEMPITANGKIDKKKLSNLNVKRNFSDVKPENNRQKEIFEIWSKYIGHKDFNIYDNFFQLGGHSLMIAKIIKEVNISMECSIKFSDFFEYPTIKELERYIYNNKIDGNIEEVHDHNKSISYTQKPIYYYMQKNPSSISYNIPFYIKIPKEIPTTYIENAYNYILKKYAILRTNYLWNGSFIDMSIRKYNYSKLSKTYFSNDSLEKQLYEGVLPFNLEKDELIRAKILENSESKYIFFDIHHIVFDGYSLQKFIMEFFEKLTDTSHDLYIEEVTPNFITRTKNEHYRKWLDNNFKNINNEPTSPIPTENRVPISQNYKMSDLKDIIKNIQNKLNINISSNSIMLSIFMLTLYKITQQDDLIVGIPFSNRKNDENIGMFVNTLPFRYKMDTNNSFVELSNGIQKQMLEYYEYEDTDIEDILNYNKGNSLFNVIFSTQVNSAFEIHEDIKLLNTKSPKSRFVFTLFENESEFDIQIDTFVFNNKDEFPDDFIQYLYNVAKSINDNIFITVKEIDILAESEILNKVEQSPIAKYNDKYSIEKMFERQVEKYPEKTAIVSGNETKTYTQINQKANQIANYLLTLGIKENSYIGLYMNRDILFIESMIAILKIGAIYVPIDKRYPKERKEYITKNSKLKYILSDCEIDETLNNSVEFININKMDKKYHEHNLRTNYEVNRSAYVIYTSGSTGNPKGVEVTHGNVMSLIFPEISYFDFSESDTWTAFHSFCFDFSVWEIYGALLNGGKLVIVPDDVARNPYEFSNLLINNKVTVLNQTPSAFYSLIDSTKSQDISFEDLKYVIFGGESLNPKKLKSWANINANTSLINMYGITETTVHVTYKMLSPEDYEKSTSNIGRPLTTLKYYILDKDLKMMPKNQVGELFVSGYGVSKGYLNQEKLTSERFIRNPYNTSEILYKTGDLVLENSYGDLEYIGRTDSQVKVRGYRIELGEVEKNINSIASVDNCKVSIQDSSETKLICYVKTTLSPNELRKICLTILPSYMVPSEFIVISSWPTTINGKLDMNSLDEYKIDLTTPKEKIIMTPTQKVIYDIWSDILQKELNDINSNFFEVGGHSLMVAKVIKELNTYFISDISFTDFYQNPTIHMLSNFIDKNIDDSDNNDKYLNIVEFNKENDNDKNIFFIHGGNGRVDTYNEFVKNELEGFNIFGLELFKNNNISRKHIKCEELASIYIEKIREKQQSGPYFVFGTCIGGTIAFEIASQLEQIYKEEVYLYLASVEAPSNIEFDTSFEKDVERYIDFIRSAVGYTKYNLYNTSIWDQIIDYCIENKLQLEQIANKINHSIQNMNRNSYFELIYRKNLTEDLIFMRKCYRPSSKFKGETTYFEANLQPLESSKKWALYCNNINYITINGDHDSIFQSQNVIPFSQIFNKLISNIKDRGNSIRI